MTSTAQNQTDRLPARSASRPFALRLGLGTAAASAFAAAVLIAIAVVDERASLIDSDAIEALQAQLVRQPADEALKNKIRDMDLRLRERYFYQRGLVNTGAGLIIGAAILVVASLRWWAFVPAAELKPIVRKMDPAAADESQAAERRRNVWSLAVIAVALLMALGALTLCPCRQAKDRIAATPGDAKGAPKTSGPAMDMKAEDNWPRFRGPNGVGIVPPEQAAKAAWPETWDAKSGANVAWKVAVPAKGHSSPIVWGGRIFLTGGDDKQQFVMCFDRATGGLTWKSAVRSPAPWKTGPDAKIEMLDATGYAAPTAVTDGRHVCAAFATADVAGFDFDGNQVWARNFGKPVNSYGLAGSLALGGGFAIFQLDQGTADDGLSQILALDMATGRTVWDAKRPVPASWSTPIVVRAGPREELVTCANPYVIAYDPAKGAELWQADLLFGDVAPSPAYADGVVYVASDNAKAAAIKAGGEGDVTKSRVVWTFEEGLPDTASPICDGAFYLHTHSSGKAICLDAKTGKVLWEHDFPDRFDASPTLVGRRIYLPDVKGVTHVFELAKEFKEGSQGSLDEEVFATPAFVDGKIYIRGEKSLYCVAKK